MLNRAAIEDLFAFTDYSWRTYADTIRPLGDDLLVKPAPGLRLARAPRRARAHRLGLRPLAR